MSRRTALAGVCFEEGLEGGAHGSFVGDVEAGEPFQCRGVVLDRLGFESEGRHFDLVRVKFGRVDLTISLYSLAYR